MYPKKPEYTELFLESLHEKRRLNELNQNKNEEDCQHIQITSPTQNLVSDLSNEEKKKCGNWFELQRKISDLEEQVKAEKKRSLRYLKIINNIALKQKQLQITYKQIAKVLKSKYAPNPNGSHNQQKITSFIQKFREIANLKNGQSGGENIFNIYYFPTYHIKIILYPDSKLDNNSYEQPFKKEHKLSFTKLQTICFQGVSQSQNSMSLQISEIRHKQANNSSQFESIYASISKLNDESEVQRFISEKQGDFGNIQQKDSKIDSMRKSKQEMNERVKQCSQQNSFHTITNSYQFYPPNLRVDSKEQIKQLQIIENHGRKPRSIKQLQQKYDQFHSILNKQLSKLDQEQIIAANSKDDSHKSQINMQHLEGYLSQNSFRKKILNDDIENQNIKKAFQLFQTFIEKLGYHFNFFGQQFKIGSIKPTPISKSNIQKIKQGPIIFQQTDMQLVLRDFSQHLQKILQAQKKQYQKLLNDKELTYYGLEHKFNQLANEKKNLQKMVDSYQIHKSIMEIKLLELQKTLHQNRNSYNIDTLTSHLRKRVSLLIEDTVEGTQSQCDILASDMQQRYDQLQLSKQKLIEGIHFLNQFINETICKNHRIQKFTLILEDDLQPQIEHMLKVCFEKVIIESSAPIQNEFIGKRMRKSGSLCSSPTFSRKFSQHQEISNGSLQLQNEQLQMKLKNKSDEVFNLSERMTTLKMDKANLQNIIEKLKKQIDDLKYGMKQILQLQKDIKISEERKSRSMASRLSNIQFLQYEQKKQFNNLYWDRDEEVKELRQKLSNYETELQKYRSLAKKKKKIIFVNQ